MTQKLNDPDLDRLVQELNQQEGEEAPDFEAVASRSAAVRASHPDELRSYLR